MYFLAVLLFSLSAHAESGDLRTAELSKQVSQDDLQAACDDNGAGIDVKNGVRYYRLEYETSGVLGEPVIASGLILVPDEDKGGPYPLLSYQHGTFVKRTDAPSTDQDGSEVTAVAALFAGNGYAVALPDGLGLGTNTYPYQPYLHADTEASSARNLLVAAKVFFAREKIPLTGELFVTGYSQGGHSSLALDRSLDADPVPGLRLVTSAAAAAPADLSGATFFHSILHPGRFSGLFSALLYYSYFKIYGNLAGTLSEAIRSPYDARLPDISAGKYSDIVAYSRLPKNPSDLFTESYLYSILSNPSHPLRLALANNDLYDWAPAEPLFLVHSQGDDIVPYASSETALAKMTARGSTVKLLTIPGKPDHIGGFLPGMKIASDVFHPFLTHTVPSHPVGRLTPRSSRVYSARRLLQF